MKRSPVPPIGLSLIVAIVYFAAAELGLSLASLHSNVTPVWPPTGIAIASLLIFGRRVWPGVFLGALAANLLTDIPVASSLGIATGNTLEALVAYWLLQKSKRWHKSFDSVASVMTFVVYAAVLAPLVSATIGSLSLCLGDPQQWDNFTSFVVDVVDGRWFWRANRFAFASLLEFTGQDQFTRCAGDCQPFRVAVDCGADCFRRLVSRTGQNVSARLPVSSMFVVGGVEV